MTENTDILEYKRFADIKRLRFIEKKLSEVIKPGGTVLDVGCGNGVISRYLGSKNYTVLGIDIDQKTIDRAQSLNIYANVSFKVKSAEQLIAEALHYDAIICSEVLEHLDNPSSLLRTLNKSLKEDGILIVTVPNGIGPRELLVTRPIIFIRQHMKVLWKFIQRIKGILGYTGKTVQSDSDNLEHVQFFTKSALVNLARQNQFEIKEFSSSNFIDDVFPFSLFTRNSLMLQKMDGQLADKLPYSVNGGFFTVWKKVHKSSSLFAL